MHIWCWWVGDAQPFPDGLKGRSRKSMQIKRYNSSSSVIPMIDTAEVLVYPQAPDIPS